MNALFAKIASSNASLKEDLFRDGKGVVLIRELLCRQFFKGNTFVARTKIVSSQSKGDKDPKTGGPVEPNGPGSCVGWPQLIDQHASAAGNVKAFTLALTGFASADVAPEDFAKGFGELVDKNQPARGMLIGYETYQQATKSGPNAGRVNTYVRWIHVPPSAGNSAADIAARRAELDKTDPLA